MMIGSEDTYLSSSEPILDVSMGPNIKRILMATDSFEKVKNAMDWESGLILLCAVRCGQGLRRPICRLQKMGISQG